VASIDRLFRLNGIVTNLAADGVVDISIADVAAWQAYAVAALRKRRPIPLRWISKHRGADVVELTARTKIPYRVVNTWRFHTGDFDERLADMLPAKSGEYVWDARASRPCHMLTSHWDRPYQPP